VADLPQSVPYVGGEAVADTPAPQANAKALKWVLLGCGVMAGLATMGLVGVFVLFRLFRPSPSAPEGHQGWTIRADRGGVAGDAGGAQVEIPGGALDHDSRIEIASRPPEIHSAPGTKVVGSVWSVQVDGKEHSTFHKPVRLSVPIDGSLAQDAGTVKLSHWETGRWRPVRGSRVEGGRAVADVDHFSEYAPTQEERRTPNAPAPSDSPYSNFLNADSWTGHIEISVEADWGTQTTTRSSHWRVSRNASLSFRLGARAPVPPGGKGIWMSREGSRLASPVRVSAAINDGGYKTDDDLDKSGNVFYYSAVTGGGSDERPAFLNLEIDPGAGTYTLTLGEFKVGTVSSAKWSSRAGSKGTPVESPACVSPFLGTRKLPPGGDVITEKIEFKRSEGGGLISPGLDEVDAPLKRTMTVTLTPGSATLAAHIVAPGSVRRADTVTLDGSTSTGDITEYAWTFTVAEDCPVEGGRQVRRSGLQASFIALWDFDAELVVKDKAGKTASAKRRVRVIPRDGAEWQTKFSTRKEDLKDAPMTAGVQDVDNYKKALEEAGKDPAKSRKLPRPKFPSGTPQIGVIQLGINQCDLDSTLVVAGHRIHTKDTKNQTWSDGGFELLRVADEGPFGGLFFVKKQSLEIKRVERVNVLLKPGSVIYAMNARQEKNNTPALNALRNEVTKHEELHSTLTRDALHRLRSKGQDPSAVLEALVGLQLGPTTQTADERLKALNLELMVASNEQAVKETLKGDPKFAGKVTIWLPATFVDDTQLNAKGEPLKTTLEVPVDLGELWNIGDE
jgi:hypothetical protein